MGQSPRANTPAEAARRARGKDPRYPEPQYIVREYMGGGIKPTTRIHPWPRVGDRFGELTVTGYELGAQGGLKAIVVRCSCGAAEYSTAPASLRTGVTTRCNPCAKKKAGHWNKNYTGYARILPDDAHRRRLMGRISACIGRCHNPTDQNYHHYGGRGIKVYADWLEDRGKFLAYVITLPGWDRPKLDLDRKDNNKGYEPGNLRFVTHQHNVLNRRNVQKLEAIIRTKDAYIDQLLSFICAVLAENPGIRLGPERPPEPVYDPD